MKVLHYVDENNLSWSETWIRLLKELELYGVQNLAVCKSGGTLCAKLYKAEIKTESCDVPIQWLPQTALRLGRIIDEFEPDIIHTRLSSAARTGGWWGKRKHIPVVQTVDKFPKACYHVNATILLACSRAVREHLLSLGLCSDRIRVLHNPIDVSLYARDISVRDQYRCRYNLKCEDRVLLAAGRFVSGKGFDVLLHSYSLMKKQRPDLFENTRLFLAGEGEERQKLLKIIKEESIKDNVIFPGFVRDIKPYLWMSDIFVFPTATQEAFGISLLEAMAAGLPSVATKSGGPEDMIEHKKSGLLVPPGSAVGITNALIDLMSDKNLRREMAENAQKRAEGFSVSKVASESVAVYKELLS